MADLDLARLKALAEKATPGPWVVIDAHKPGIDGDDGKFTIVLFGDEDEPEGVHRKEDAAYIAALDPATVLALIARAEELERIKADAERFAPDRIAPDYVFVMERPKETK